MTVQMLREFGVRVDDSEPDVWRVEPGPIAARDFTVEPDLSNAAPFLSAAMVTGGTVTIPGWPSRTTQPGDQLRTCWRTWAPRWRARPAGWRSPAPGGSPA